MSERPTNFHQELVDLHDSYTDETGNLRARLGLVQESLRVMLDDVRSADKEQDIAGWLTEMVQILANHTLAVLTVMEAAARDEIQDIRNEMDDDDDAE